METVASNIKCSPPLFYDYHTIYRVIVSSDVPSIICVIRPYCIWLLTYFLLAPIFRTEQNIVVTAPPQCQRHFALACNKCYSFNIYCVAFSQSYRTCFRKVYEERWGVTLGTALVNLSSPENNFYTFVVCLLKTFNIVLIVHIGNLYLSFPRVSNNKHHIL